MTEAGIARWKGRGTRLPLPPLVRKGVCIGNFGYTSSKVGMVDWCHTQSSHLDPEKAKSEPMEREA